MTQHLDTSFIYITTQLVYEAVSNAALRQNMTVAEYVSLAISRQIEEDENRAEDSPAPKETT